jgi:hypothetical protein
MGMSKKKKGKKTKSKRAAKGLQETQLYLRPLKKIKGCGTCLHYVQYYCAFCPGEDIPAKVFKKGCEYRSKVKIFF